MAGKAPDSRWFFSLRSPYSWFAYRELTERHPEVLASIRWIPYWDPDERTTRLLAERGLTLPLVQMSRAKNFYILQDARRWARSRGWTMTWPIDRAPRWEIPHLAYLAADEAGLGREFVAAAYRYRWDLAKPLCEADTMAEIAAELGLDAALLRDAVDDERLLTRGIDYLAEVCRDDAFGVPFFVHGREKFWGAERANAFAATVRGEPLSHPEDLSWHGFGGDAVAVGADSDVGHAGGCG